MEIYANGKNIPTYPFSRLFRQGEKFADTITIIVDRYYGENDLSMCSFVMRGVNENNEEALQPLIPDVSDYSLIFRWNVSESFTAASGKLSLELRASKTDENDEPLLIMKYSMESVTVTESPSGENIPLPSASEQIISEIAEAANFYIEQLMGFDIEAVNNRLDAMDTGIAEFLARPEVIPITQSEYDVTPHKRDALYVIVKEG